MAESSQDTSQITPLAADFAKAIVSQIVSLENIERLAKGNENALVAWSKIVIGILLGGAGAIGATLAEVIVGAEEVADPAFQRLMAVAFKDITGVDLGGAGQVHGGRDSRNGAARNLGASLMAAIAGGPGAGAGAGGIEPSAKGAEDYVTWVTQMSLEGWLTGVLGECVTLGQVESLGDLDDALANSLGLGRMTRRVMAPLLDAKVIAPFRWHVERTYRPQLLASGEVARQVARGRWTRERATEELARQGYSDERIEALLNAAARFHTAADLDLLVRAGERGIADAEQHLRDQGYPADVAKLELQLERLKRIASFERAMAGAAVDAFVAGRIGEGELGGFATGTTIDAQEKAQYVELAAARRALASRPITSAEAEQCVKAGILSYVDYRAALRRENRTEDAIAALELLLRFELDKAKTVAEHREQRAAEVEAERQRRLDAAAARKAEVEAARALERRGRRADLERAAVIGLLPLSRVAELYAATYDPDVAATLLELLEGERLAYVEQQAARAEAAKRGAVRSVDVGALDAAVVAGMISIGEYRSRLQQLGFPPADVDLLAGTLEAKIADRLDAEQQRAQAAAAAKIRRVSLSTIETLVRRGHRSMQEYDRTLADLGFDDAARAYMRELLQLQIDDDAKRRAAREAAEAQLRPRGLSLEQFRRGVLLGLRSIDDFQTFLITERFTPEAAQLLVAELRFDVEEAEAARQRRRTAEAATDTRALPLSVVARAARLGRISVETYRGRLERNGYSPDDIEIEIDLLVHELAETAAARQRRDEAEIAARSRGLSLADTARAVRAGTLPIESYAEAIRAAGFDANAAGVLTRLLMAEIADAETTEARRTAIELAGDARRLSLAQLAAAVKARLRSLEDYYTAIRGLGYADEDAALLTELLERELAIVDVAETRDDELSSAQPEAHATLGAVGQAVKEGLITMRAYVDELIARGYGQAPQLAIDRDGRAVLDDEAAEPFTDTELLALLLQVQLDAAATKGAT